MPNYKLMNVDPNWIDQEWSFRFENSGSKSFKVYKVANDELEAEIIKWGCTVVSTVNELIGKDFMIEMDRNFNIISIKLNAPAPGTVIPFQRVSCELTLLRSLWNVTVVEPIEDFKCPECNNKYLTRGYIKGRVVMTNCMNYTCRVKAYSEKSSIFKNGAINSQDSLTEENMKNLGFSNSVIFTGNLKEFGCWLKSMLFVKRMNFTIESASSLVDRVFNEKESYQTISNPLKLHIIYHDVKRAIPAVQGQLVSYLRERMLDVTKLTWIALPAFYSGEYYNADFGELIADGTLKVI